MQIEVRALDKEEFDAAETGECACASWTLHTGKGLKTSYLYIYLGRQVPFAKNSEKHDQTQFKRFLDCSIEAYETLDDLDNGIATNTQSGIDVVLFY
ncbi:MAG: hypothetical protein HC852_01590 [Acaryochloridaceae cyanobacterium RU_4_10]|nr:hypothetical protein [Acaryochloridaceae cyanobacterium RU_4_10]